MPVISCVFAPSLDTPAHIELAERLGYRRAWCYDSPALCADPWMVLALAAGRTRAIGLGPASLVPSLRHPVVTAAALATLAGLAPGRVSTAFGTGLTGRMLLGERPMRWAAVEEYVAAVRALLRGEEASWNGSLVRLSQAAGFAARLPADVAVLIAADGPRGRAVAAELGDGVLTARVPRDPAGAGPAAGAAGLRHRPGRRRGRGEPAGGRGRRPRPGRRLPRHLRVEGRRRGRQAAGRQAVAGGGGGGRGAKAAPRDPRRPPGRARPARRGAARPGRTAARQAGP